MVGDEHAYVALFEFPHDELDVLHCRGIHSGEGLIEHDELGVDGQTACYLGASALASREAVTQVLAHLLQAELLNEALQLLLLIVAGLARHLQYAGDVVLHRHLAKHAGLLRQVAYAQTGTFIYRQLGNLFVAQIDVSRVGDDQPGGHVERRGLAGSIGAQQTHNLALMHIETHIAHHRALSVNLHQAFAAQLQMLRRGYSHAVAAAGPCRYSVIVHNVSV